MAGDADPEVLQFELEMARSDEVQTARRLESSKQHLANCRERLDRSTAQLRELLKAPVILLSEWRNLLRFRMNYQEQVVRAGAETEVAAVDVRKAIAEVKRLKNALQEALQAVASPPKNQHLPVLEFPRVDRTRDQGSDFE